MSDIKISQLPETLNLDEDSVLPVVFQDETQKITLKSLKEILQYYNNISYNKTTGQFIFTKSNNQQATLDTGLDQNIKDVTFEDNNLIFTKNNNTQLSFKFNFSDDNTLIYFWNGTSGDIGTQNEAMFKDILDKHNEGKDIIIITPILLTNNKNITMCYEFKANNLGESDTDYNIFELHSINIIQNINKTVAMTRNRIYSI